MMNGSVQEENITIINMHAPNVKAHKYTNTEIIEENNR